MFVSKRNYKCIRRLKDSTSLRIATLARVPVKKPSLRKINYHLVLINPHVLIIAVVPIRCVCGTQTLDAGMKLVENHTRRKQTELKFPAGEDTPVIDNPKDPDIQDVMREEKSRGKRRVDTKALELRQHCLKALREALTNSKTEREFVEAIRELGYGDDSEKLREALKIWRSSFSV
jgi:hypothetical protein